MPPRRRGQDHNVAGFSRTRPARRPFPGHLPRERVVVPGPAACACCGGTRLSKLGEDVTETLEVVPRTWKVIQHVREKFSCRDCERISQPPSPFHVTPRGWAGPSLLAMILFEKFGQRQPLNRQAERYGHEGVPLSLSTLADQVGACGKQFNERSGTLLNRTQYPSDVVALVVLWRLRFKLALRDLFEMFAQRGMVFSYEAVRQWEAKLTPVLAEDLRRRRHGKVGRSWYVDETYIKVSGRWCYLYRAIDSSGRLVDVLFSERRGMKAAKAFFRSAKAVTGVTPDRVTTDGHDSYPRAIRTELGKAVRHRTSRYLNNRIEQDHRGLKGRYRSMRGFKCPLSAARFCCGHDELRHFLRARSRHNQHVPDNQSRLRLLRRTATVLAILEAA